MPLEDIEKRVEKLEKNATSDNDVARTITRCVLFAFVMTLGSAYGCERLKFQSEIEVAKVAASKCTEPPKKDH